MSSGTIVITGGCGFVGRHLAAELRRAWPAARVVVWDQQVGELPRGVTGAVIDITEPGSYREQLAALAPAWIAHLAAVPSAGQARLDESRAWRVNVAGTRHLLEAVAALSPSTRVLAVSTADIYGQGSSTSLSELPLAAAQPMNPYAESKWEMERVIEESFADRVLRVRPFPHVGPGQALGYVTADFASQVAAIEAGRQARVIRVGNLEAARDFTDVRDVVRAYRLLMECGMFGSACTADEHARGTCGVYHVASGRAVRIQDVLDQLLAFAMVPIAVEQDPVRLRPADTAALVGDASKLHQAAADLGGWRPRISLEQSLRDILAWWRQRVAVAV